MKLARWFREGTLETGVIHDGRVHPFAGVPMLQVLQSGLTAALDLAATAIADTPGTPIDEVVLTTPLQPPSVRDFVAFEEHVEGVVKSVSGETGGVVAEWYQAPTFYFTNPHTLRASGESVPVPADSAGIDFELEVAAVVGAVEGSSGSDLTPEQAHQHIFGYMILNDWSARDLQRREMKVSLGPCKGKDFASTIGPWIVTADEFEDLHDDEGFLPIQMSVSINGVEFGRDLLSNMGWPFAELVAYAARGSRIVPGDVLGSGTSGTGCLAELWGRVGSQTPPPLTAGDTVSMEVEGIGRIENTLVASEPLPPVLAARTRSRSRVRVP
ncbi:fumarylacetoacetate hydrolase family protein [Subtercola sp. YIM 133946]|uniref:fumarylacetoacetate hydrolase family protein n=1 Tax=Subtercola sp. YIM 133946 TaxID=3118909 RepID=UPI002F93D463